MMQQDRSCNVKLHPTHRSSPAAYVERQVSTCSFPHAKPGLVPGTSGPPPQKAVFPRSTFAEVSSGRSHSFCDSCCAGPHLAVERVNARRVFQVLPACAHGRLEEVVEALRRLGHRKGRDEEVLQLLVLRHTPAHVDSGFRGFRVHLSVHVEHTGMLLLRVPIPCACTMVANVFEHLSACRNSNAAAEGAGYPAQANRSNVDSGMHDTGLHHRMQADPRLRREGCSQKQRQRMVWSLLCGLYSWAKHATHVRWCAVLRACSTDHGLLACWSLDRSAGKCWSESATRTAGPAARCCASAAR